jgi:hypothetical protein
MPVNTDAYRTTEELSEKKKGSFDDKSMEPQGREKPLTGCESPIFLGPQTRVWQISHVELHGLVRRPTRFLHDRRRVNFKLQHLGRESFSGLMGDHVEADGMV